MEKFVKDKRRNIHSAGGSAGTDYKTEGKSYSDSAKDCTEEYIIGKVIVSENTVANFEEKRVAERTQNGGHCEGFSKNKISETKHCHIENKNKYGNRNMEKVFDYKCNTGWSSKGDSGRKNKKLYGQSVDDISENNADIWEEFLPEIFNFIHLNSPFEIIKKRLPRIFPQLLINRFSGIPRRRL